MNNPNEHSERRRHPRLRAKVPIELRAGKTGAPLRTATDEISLCGCYIETMFTLDVGTRLTITFSLNNEQWSVSAVVVTKYPQVGNGIDFVDMKAEDREKLQAFIAAQETESAK